MQTSRSNQDDEVPTLGVLRRGHSWLWICCEGKDCARSAAVALTPFIIRWGAEASSNLLRRNARCQILRHKGRYHSVAGLVRRQQHRGSISCR